jgi:hypothetical protein
VIVSSILGVIFRSFFGGNPRRRLGCRAFFMVPSSTRHDKGVAKPRKPA